MTYEELESIKQLSDTIDKMEKLLSEYQNDFGKGLFIDAYDRKGNPIHVGDTLEFDKEEFGEECIFVIKIKNGQINYPGAYSDLSEFCTIIKKVWE